jgi:hypothetical protein
MRDRDRFSEDQAAIDVNIARSDGKKELRPPPGAAEEVGREEPRADAISDIESARRPAGAAATNLPQDRILACSAVLVKPSDRSFPLVAYRR